MSVELECIGCREQKVFEIPDKYPVCYECLEWDTKHVETINKQEWECPLCSYIGVAIENHHIDGRKVSDRTISICANCHTEIHRGARELGL